MTGEHLGALAAELRRAFDGSFADEPRRDEAQREDLLAIRVGGEPFAIRLADLSGLVTGCKVTPLPSEVSGLLGLASFRGTLVPAYLLRVLLGYPEAQEARWLALVGKDRALGLVFDGFEGYVRVPAEAVTRRVDGEAMAPLPFVQRIVKAGDIVRPVVDVPSILAAIEQRGRRGGQRKET